MIGNQYNNFKGFIINKFQKRLPFLLVFGRTYSLNTKQQIPPFTSTDSTEWKPVQNMFKTDSKMHWLNSTNLRQQLFITVKKVYKNSISFRKVFIARESFCYWFNQGTCVSHTILRWINNKNLLLQLKLLELNMFSSIKALPVFEKHFANINCKLPTNLPSVLLRYPINWKNAGAF